jgi:hypothetical protein
MAPDELRDDKLKETLLETPFGNSVTHGAHNQLAAKYYRLSAAAKVFAAGSYVDEKYVINVIFRDLKGYKLQLDAENEELARIEAHYQSDRDLQSTVSRRHLRSMAQSSIPQPAGSQVKLHAKKKSRMDSFTASRARRKNPCI